MAMLADLLDDSEMAVYTEMPIEKVNGKLFRDMPIPSMMLMLRDLLANFVKGGGTIFVCSPCFKKRGLDEKTLVDGATIVGGAKVVEFLASGAPCISY